MKLHERAASIRDKGELVAFIGALAEDLEARPGEWENATLGQFLSAWARWLADSDGYYLNQGVPPPNEPTWKNIAEMLIAARMYE